VTDSLIRASLPLELRAPGARVAPGGPPAPRTLVDIFSATVLRCATRTAVAAADAVLSYDALARETRVLARRLRGLGIGPGDRVGVRVPSGSAQLYIAILGVLHAGAAYVPVDADDPEERASAIWLDSGACAVVEADLRIVELGQPHATTRTLSVEDDAWIIFTSGSTGRPKGVAVTHRAAAAFVDAETELWTVASDDRVLAGLSVGFDASCEEMWLAWRNGATLVPAPRALVRAAADLGPWLAEREVSVISTVPTLAAMWSEADIAGVRLLILGGEACPDALGWRLAAGREVWNTYGPTETTVVATAKRLRPDAPVTIGWPLRGWDIAIVDEAGEQVPLGDAGELAIGGVGLGRYLDPELDRLRYAELPTLGWSRAYRTGDIVRETIDGLEFIGRRDHQVKIGGRRLELGEIEAQLSAVPGVRGAAAAVQKAPAGNPVLVGYVVAEVDPGEIRAALAKQLPDGIVPLVVPLATLPTSSSGKVDRKQLPWPPPEPTVPASPGALSGDVAWLADRWAEQLGARPAGPEANFFELGGSSLAAAKLVSVLRERYPAVAVADVYEHRRLGQFAARLAEIGTASPQTSGPLPTPPLRFGLGQLVGVVVLMALRAVPWLIAALAYGNVVDIGLPHVAWGLLAGAWLLLASPPARTATYLLARRVLLHRLEPGRYSRYSWLAGRLWFLERLCAITHLDRLGGTPWAESYARLLGAKVGADARLAVVPPAGALLHIGAGATIEANADVHGWWIDGQELVLGEIRIGAHARVGSRTLLNPGTVIGEGAEIEPGSVVSGSVPAGEHWGGSPARYLGQAGAGWPTDRPAPTRYPRLWRAMFGVSLGVEALLSLAALVPAVLVLMLVGTPAPGTGSSLAWIVFECALVTVVTVPTFAALVALTLRLVWKLVRPGYYADDGAVGWALWFGEDLRTKADAILFPLYASLFTAPWLRLMGINVGRRAEASTATGLSPLISLGAYTQATDDVAFCGVRSRGGTLVVEPITIAERTFLGPSSVIRGGTRIAEDSLVGALTLAPRRPPSGTSWFGVPALELPRVPDRGDRARTTDPPRRLVAARAAMDLLRILGPNTISVLIGVWDLFALSWLFRTLGPVAMIALAPLVMLVAGLAVTAFTVAVKWLVIGRYRPGQHPLWSFFVWRDELMNTVQEQLAGPSLLQIGLGTPLMSLYLRAMGSRVGRGVWFDTLAVTEFDMVELGHGTAVNRNSCLMTHLFHDRLLRIGPTTLGPGATVGPQAAILPDTKIGAGTSLGGRSVVLRGEQLPPGTRWHGAPVRSA
jgi:non-ribosomal peptide synthetase-like protein